MTVAEAMREIEGHSVAARVNLASDLRTFLRAVQQEPAVKVLLDRLSDDETINLLVSKASELSRQPADPRYENPWDPALAIYLWLLTLRSSHLARIAAEAVAQAPQCWWASTLADYIRTTNAVQSNAAVESHNLDASAIGTERASTADETIVPARRIADLSQFRLVQGKGTVRSSENVKAFSSNARWPGASRSQAWSAGVSKESTLAA